MAEKKGGEEVQEDVWVRTWCGGETKSSQAAGRS